MNRGALSALSADDLVVRFEDAAIQQAYELDAGRQSEVNRLYWILNDIRDELKRRKGDQRRALLILYDHPNPQVSLKAAKATLAVEPALARAKLQQIRDMRHYPQSLEAGMSLWNLETGVYKAT